VANVPAAVAQFTSHESLSATTTRQCLLHTEKCRRMLTDNIL